MVDVAGRIAHVRPVSPDNRIEMLDALRGFALLGILLANILLWSGWDFMSPAERIALAGPVQTQITVFFHALLIDGKFYTLFSLLFGIGLHLQIERLDARGADGTRIFRRRMLVLLAIGLVHLVLVWEGDILTLYALIGLLLPMFRNWSDEALLKAALALIALPLVMVPLLAALGWQPGAPFFALGDGLGRQLGIEGSELSWLQRSDPASLLIWNLDGWLYRIGGLLESWRIPKVLGIMLLGMVIGRRVANNTLASDRRTLWRVMIGGLIVGLPFSIAYAVAGDMRQDSLPSLVGTVPMALAYAAAFLLAWPRMNSVLRLFAPPGRMALSNYLMHSLCGIFIFYGVGLGLIGRVPPAGIYAIALLIFAGQMALSPRWLSRFGRGPMERLWRWGTYGRWQSTRRTGPSEVQHYPGS